MQGVLRPLTSMQGVLLPLLSSFLLIGHVVGPGLNRQEKAEEDKDYNIEGVPNEIAQAKEYFRYVKKVINILEQDPEFIERGKQEVTSEQVREGFLIKGLMPLVKTDTADKLNRLKVEEIQHQKRLLADNKEHMKQKQNNEWNPIHHEEKDQLTFTQGDLEKLLNRFNELQDAIDTKRKDKFKKREMKKELKFRKELKNLTEEDQAKVKGEHDEEQKKKPHDRMHAPGHKAQLEEVWEEQDGLDKDAFDSKTFFFLHDKNSDGYLDMFELETLFLSDLDKVYNESDPHTDSRKREEEMQRMREMAMKEMDINNDGLISLAEYKERTSSADFEDDPEWDPVDDVDQFTEEELMKFEEEEDEDFGEGPDDDFY